MTNAPVDPLVIIELTNLKAAGELWELAHHPALATKPEWMRELAQNKHAYIRSTLAQNPAITSCLDVLKKLVCDEDPDVRYWVAEVQDIPYPEIIQTLASDKDHHVRTALARNPALVVSDKAIATLAKDRSKRVRWYLSRSATIANCPDAVKRLATDKDYEVRYALAYNPAIASYPEVIHVLTKDADQRIRNSLASNPARPSSTASSNPWQATQPVTQVPAI